MNTKIVICLTAALSVAACSGTDSPAPPQAINQAPTISVIADQSVDANQTSQPINFTVTDEQVASLTVSVMSDNPGVIPENGLDVSGSGESRALTVSPVVDTVGDSLITVAVTDTDGLSANVSFLLTVDPLQVSLQQFTRDSFAQAANGDPEPINALAFSSDADADEFADLLTQ